MDVFVQDMKRVFLHEIGDESTAGGMLLFVTWCLQGEWMSPNLWDHLWVIVQGEMSVGHVSIGNWCCGSASTNPIREHVP